jgi:ATP-dependent DNA ligase
MLATAVDVVPEGSDWTLEPKFDGWRALLVVEQGPDLNAPFEVGVFGGRNAANYTGQLPYLEREAEQRLPAGTVLDGELVALDKSWGSVQSVMTSSRPCDDPRIVFMAFDVLRDSGADVRGEPWTARRARLVELLKDLDAEAPIKLTPTIDSGADAAQAFIARGGFEGVVCKRKASKYHAGRAAAWVKYKPQSTCEARVVGFKAGERGGEFDGMVGAFEVELLDSGARTTVKCGTVARHRDATEHPERWTGAIIEIKHHGIGESGVPRHPQFLRRRDDRMPAAPARTAPTREAPARRSGASGRNYKAMGDAKLVAAIASLEKRSGDAYDRCVAKGADPDADLAEAYAAAREKGMGGIPAS